MGKYVKKPVIIEAVQWTGDNSLDIAEFVKDTERKYEFKGDALFIHTLEGSMRASKNDYIIKGVEGEFYPCKPEIFEKTYANENAIGELSDGYHTYNELYDFRKMYNAALFNEWGKAKEQHPDWWKEGKPFYVFTHNVHKSWRHYDGELCFGGGWFIVSAMLPTGQISNHYKAEDWDLFQIPETDKALYEFDGHTGKDVLDRLRNLTKSE
jgi:hypothetical protein